MGWIFRGREHVGTRIESTPVRSILIYDFFITGNEIDTRTRHARDALAKYHQSLDEIPPPVLKKSKSKQSLRPEESTEDSPAPPSKRQKRNGADRSVGDREETWTPSKEDWEPFVVRVDAVEKDDAGQLLAYILFKNNKKTKVSMDKVYRHCPRPMLRFYEEHLKFK